MPYVTNVERIGIKKGILIGEVKGIPPWPSADSAPPTHPPLRSRIPVGAIHELPLRADRILDAESLDAVFTER